MITRMYIGMESKNPCAKKPAIFSVGSFEIKANDKLLRFDFQDSETSTEIKDGYLYTETTLRNFDYEVYPETNKYELDSVLRRVRKEGFTEIFYECYEEPDEKGHIEMIPVRIVFEDNALGHIIEVEGKEFSSLEDENSVQMGIEDHVFGNIAL